jgi:phage-related baseplate assembly protein
MSSSSAPFSNITPFAPLPTDANNLLSEAVTLYQTNWLANTGQAIVLTQSDPRYQQLQTICAFVANLFGMSNLAYNQNFLPLAQGAFLDGLVALLGPNATRLEESYATVTLQFSLSAVQATPQTVPAGTSVAVTGNSALSFATTADLTIPAGQLSATATATCNQIGSIGNGFVAGQIASLQNWAQPFLVAAVNTNTSEGGANTETDSAMQNRDFFVTETYTTGGSYGSYTELTLAANPAIQGCTVVGPESDLVFPAINVSINAGSNPGQIPNDLAGTEITPGQVYITVLMDGGAMPTPAICSEVWNNVTPFNPLTDQVFVNGPEKILFPTNVSFYIDSENVANETTTIANVTAAVNNWVSNTSQKLGRSIDPTSLIGQMYAQGASRVVLTGMSYQAVQPWQLGSGNGSVTIVYNGLENDNLN